MTRWILFIALLLSAACARQEQVTVLRVANWGGAGTDSEFDKKVLELNKQFEKDNPGCRVVIEGVPGGEYVQKMLLNHVAGSMPDIMIVDGSSAAVFMDNGILEDLTPYAKNDFLDQFFPVVLAPYRRQEKLYAIPGDFTPMVMYYNKDMFDKAGLPYPNSDWSPEDFERTAIALTKPEDKQYGYIFTNWMPGWVLWFWSFGGEVLGTGDQAVGTFDSKENVKALEFLRNLVKKGAAPTLSASAALGSDPFSDGRAAMTISGHWSMTGFKTSKKIDWKRVGVIEVPHLTAMPNTVLYMAGYGIAAKSKHKDLAWRYLQLWTSYDIQKVYNATGIAVSARQDVANERADIGNPTPNEEQSIERSFLRIVPQGRPPYGSRVEGYAVVEQLGQSMMDTILSNDADIQTALTETAKKIDREFAKRL